MILRMFFSAGGGARMKPIIILHTLLLLLVSLLVEVSASPGIAIPVVLMKTRVLIIRSLIPSFRDHKMSIGRCQSGFVLHSIGISTNSMAGFPINMCKPVWDPWSWMYQNAPTFAIGIYCQHYRYTLSQIKSQWRERLERNLLKKRMYWG